MITKNEIVYKAAPYGYVATIPKGTRVMRATNLPEEDGAQFFAEAWGGMDTIETMWHRNYGFLLGPEEVELS